MRKLEPSPFLKGVTAYATPLSKTPVDLYLNGNEGGCPPASVLEAVRRSGVEAVRRYPDDTDVSATIAEMLGIAPDSVLVTAGADDALGRVIRAMLAPGREMILPVPTFEMIGRYARLSGGTVNEIHWPEGPLPVTRMIDAGTARTALVAVVTPNSPMGQVATSADLSALSSAFPEALLLVDLAYTDFADTDLTHDVLALPNAVLVRSLSKAWGLAGLRVGYAAGPSEVMAWLNAAGHPYCVSSLSLAAAEERLRTGKEDVQAFVGEVRRQRERLTARLAEVGTAVSPSSGNFVFARFDDALWVRDALSGLGIVIRAFPGHPFLEGGVRVTVPGNDEDYERLEHGLLSVLAPEAILFDIDDTLADVTDSYRQATVATAAAFGVKITFDDITAAKAAGDANNDWELTCRLVNDAGVSASLSDVTETFEAFYQGTAETTGFKNKETLLCERELIVRLAKRLPLGIVTGRPRSDAMEFLRKMALEHLFSAVVSMDDAPVKPSPEPVRLALTALGVKRAWMVGDTPDDMRAARSAGVVPLGVCAPADDPVVAREALTAAGAGRVLASLDEVERRLT